MTSVQAAHNPGSERPAQEQGQTERSEPADGFGALFAQFAQGTVLGASRNGSMALRIGGGTGVSGRAGLAQELPGGLAQSASGGTGLRDGARAVTGARRPLAKQSGQDTTSPSDRASARELRGVVGERPAERAAPGSAAHQRTGTGGVTPDSGGEHQSGRSADSAPQHAALVGVGGAARAAQSAGMPSASGSQAIGAAGKASGAGSSQALAGPVGATAAQARSVAASPKPAAANRPAPQQQAAFRSQLAQGLGAALRRGEGDVTIRMRPHTLGDLQVSLQVRGGVVDAQVRPSTVEAHRLLEQSVEVLRQAFEARGLQAGRIEVQPPPDGKDAQAGDGQQAHSQSQEGRAGSDREGRGPEDSARGDHGAGQQSPPWAGEEEQTAMGLGSPGIVYSVADGAARIVMIDALA